LNDPIVLYGQWAIDYPANEFHGKPLAMLELRGLDKVPGRSDKKIATDFFIVRVNDTAPKKV